MMRLLLSISLLAFVASPAIAAPIFAPSYVATTTFSDALTATTMTIAYDGTNYWSSSGGGPGGVRYAQYDSAGNLVATFSPGIDFRSVITDAMGNVYARGYASSVIRQQTATGVFGATPVTLVGGALDTQSSVVLNGPGTEFIAMEGGTVTRWDLAGNLLGTVALSGYGSGAGENSYPNDRGIAAAGNYWLTYSQGVLSAWDFLGNRVDQTTLIGAGTSFDSHFSLSYANNQVFIVDQAGGQWRGFDVGLGVAAEVPEPASIAVWSLLSVAGLAAWRRRRNVMAA